MSTVKAFGRILCVPPQLSERAAPRRRIPSMARPPFLVIMTHPLSSLRPPPAVRMAFYGSGCQTLLNHRVEGVMKLHNTALRLALQFGDEPPEVRTAWIACAYGHTVVLVCMMVTSVLDQPSRVSRRALHSSHAHGMLIDLRFDGVLGHTGSGVAAAGQLAGDLEAGAFPDAPPDLQAKMQVFAGTLPRPEAPARVPNPGEW